MSSKDKLMETFIRQYVISRNTIINDPMEMRSRWNRGGMVNFLSSPEVFDAFNRSTQANWEIYSNRRWSARWKSFPSASRAAKRVRFGKWILKHMTCMTNKAKSGAERVDPAGSLLDRFRYRLFHQRAAVYGPPSAQSAGFYRNPLFSDRGRNLLALPLVAENLTTRICLSVVDKYNQAVRLLR